MDDPEVDQELTDKLIAAGFPPFNIFDTDDLGRPFTPAVYKSGNSRTVTLHPDTDIASFEKATGIKVLGSMMQNFGPNSMSKGDKGDRGLSDLFIYWKI